jgi:CHAT domain-containing protein
VIRRQGDLGWAELGDARAIDEAIEAWREALRDPKRRDARQLARALDEKLMQPVRPLLGDASHLLISPEGALNLIPFEALVDEQNRYLVERFAFTYLTSGRDLLRMQVARASKSQPLVLANPSFGEPELLAVTKPNAPPSPRASLDKRQPGRTKRQSVTTGSDLSSVYFAPLPGTAQEAQAIKSLFAEADLLTGARATESSLKQISAPRIMHIATHGFFLTDAPPPSPNAGGEKTLSISANLRIENPLLRSGLALAGANLRKSSDDGILTAMEASGLNLWGTKLVTLSACDTGLGEVKNGEGVYGLRRAFALAGTEALVMSLWPVSDYVTRELMTAYYQGLKQGQGRGEALRQVQLSLLKRRGREHPFYWASFIQSGEWANLDGKR